MSVAVKRVGIVGSGIMGSGIAEVAAKAGHRGRAAQPRADHGRRDGRGAREVARPSRSSRGKLEAAERDEVLGRVRAVTDLGELAECDLVLESIVEDLGVEEAPLQRARPHLPRRADPGHEHVDAAGGRDGDGDRPPRPGVRHPLLQPGADDAAGRGRARDHDVRRDDRRRARRSPRRAARTRCTCGTRPGSSSTRCCSRT